QREPIRDKHEAIDPDFDTLESAHDASQTVREGSSSHHLARCRVLDEGRGALCSAGSATKRCEIRPSAPTSRVLTTRCLKPIGIYSNGSLAMLSTLVTPTKQAAC